MKRNYFIAGGIIILVTLIVTAIVFPSLPDRVPVHWNIRNQVDRYGSPSSVFLIPVIMAATMLLMAVLPWLSPRRFEMGGEQRPAYLQIMIVLLAGLAWFQTLILAATLGRHFAMGQAIMGGVCAMIAVMGALLRRVPRNFYVGIRTPWTLASTDVWEATHRFAAKTFVVAGVAGVALTFLFHQAIWPPFVAITAGAFAPVVYSLLYYKRLERRGEI